jgi:hypothetical protein
MCFFVFCMSRRVRVASFELEKNCLEGKYHRSQDTRLALDDQKIKDRFLCFATFLG